MKVLELFAGTRSIGKAFEKRGHEVFSVDWNKKFENIDLYADISTVTAEEIIAKFGKPDVIWASPDCTTFSIAAISHHRRKNEITGNLDPVSDYAKFCDKADMHVLDLIRELNPKYFFIENPRGGMRKMTWMRGIPRYTVTYCQYGDNRMKPTDIWSNHPDPKFKPPCHNGDSCHTPAPRGSKTGTQGLKGSVERSMIPAELCEHIVDICEETDNSNKIIPFPDKKYSIIYADPPWQYNDTTCEGAAAAQYGTIPLDKLMELPVKELAEKDCILFLWATYPKLREALELIPAWGFQYKSIAFQWIKQNKSGNGYYFGLGRWTRGNTEPCLIATKGKPHRISPKVGQLVFSPLRQHSQKPPEVRDRIVELVGDLPRIELFARDKADGWDVWGDQAPEVSTDESNTH